MAKLHFYYSAMNAGKSTLLLQSSYNYQERGMDTLLLMPQIDTRGEAGKITSRIGLFAQADIFSPTDNLLDRVSHALEKKPALRCVLLDEAQFLTREQVRQLCHITDQLDIPVLAYGIRSDFRGEPFPGSLYLLTWADQLLEMKTICHCGRKATMNQRIDDAGKPILHGDQVEIGGNERYRVTCRKHFHF